MLSHHQCFGFMQRADARRIASLAAFNLALGAIATPGVARAQTTLPPAPAVIHACYVPLTGTLYRIDETGLHQGCTSPTHVEFSWTDGLGAVRTTDALTGDLGGTFAAPSVVGLQGHALSTTAPAAGQVLTFDGSKWGPATASATFTNASVNGSFLATGTFGSGTIPATGAGIRMMWYPAKAAFRVGGPTGMEWDDGNIGQFSVAMGSGTTASGNYSMATGIGAVASGSASTAVGQSTKATALGATAAGISSVASGPGATAMGLFTTAGGGSTALGSGSTAGSSASTAIGDHTTAMGAGSTAMGSETSAGGDGSTAMGNSTVASGIDATAMGKQTQATGNQSTAIGFNTVASGAISTAMGINTTASGDNSIALGTNASTNGQTGSFVYGDNSTTTPIKANVPNQFVVRAQHIWFGTNTSVTAPDDIFLLTSTGAYLSTGGVWTNLSDVNRKEAFQPIPGEDVLTRLAAMPVQEWSYKAEGPSIRHIGPTAQDFYRAFRLGSSNTSIGTIDADGVSLAAIKALAQRTTDLASENAKLRSENERLSARLDAIEAALATLGVTPRIP